MYSSSVLLDSTLDFRANHEATTFLLLFVYTVLCTYILVKFVHDFAKFEHGNALVHQTGLVHCPKNSLNLSRKTEPVADEADATVYSTVYLFSLPNTQYVRTNARHDAVFDVKKIVYHTQQKIYKRNSRVS